jgi:archaellum component FlaG (FlaF/FlaG flagellin family)
VVASLAIFNGLYPAISRSSGAVSSAADKINNRIQSQVEIIHVSDNGANVNFWVKNVGASYIAPIDQSDIFFGIQGDFERVPYGSDGAPYPYWDYQLEGGASDWRPEATLKVTIHLESSPSADTYLIKMVIHNGVSDQTTFSVG